MEELLELQEIFGIGAQPLSLVSTIFNFIACVIMSFVVRFFYIKYSYSLTGKIHIASIMPILACVIFLVIIIVKSSLALSLGLVGALSIVRFRTPIKEPEELVYLFLVIAIGLGYGSGYTLITTIISSCILFVIYIPLFKKESVKTNEYNIVVDWKDSNIQFNDLVKAIEGFCDTIKLIRLDSGATQSTAVLLVTPSTETSIDNLIEKIKNKQKQIGKNTHPS